MDCEANETCNLTFMGCEADADADAAVEVDAAVDATPIVPCEGDNQCVAEVPTDWIGPLVYNTADTVEELAACPAGYSEEVGVLGAEANIAGSCECSCGTIANRVCSPALVFPDPRTPCGTISSACQATGNCLETISLPDNVSMFASSHADRQILQNLGEVTSGTCESATTISEFTSAFQSHSRLCRAVPSTDACLEGELCAPEIPADFAGQQCIAREGEFACPESGPYTERTILYASIDDQRSCDSSACSCTGVGESCGGRVRLEQLLLNSTPIIADPITLCFQVPNLALLIYRYLPEPNQGCTLAGAASIVGNALPAGATTMCCEPVL